MTSAHASELLLGAGYGDAFGAGYEVRWRTDLLLRYPGGWREVLSEDYAQSMVTTLPPGSYTDDTQMSVAVAEALLEAARRGRLPDADCFAEHFVKAYQRDPRDGYARGLDGAEGFQELLARSANGAHLRSLLRPYSKRNGAAMRAAPIGILARESDLVACAIENTLVTHATDEGIASSVAIALCSRYAPYSLGVPADIGRYAAEGVAHICSTSARHFLHVARRAAYDPEAVLGRRADGSIRRSIPVNGLYTMGAVLHLISSFGYDPPRLLGEAILLGGDTDTVASIAVGIAAGAAGTASLPPHVINGLEDGPFGRSFLQNLGERLAEASA